MSAKKALDKLKSMVDIYWYLAPAEAKLIEQACEDTPKPKKVTLKTKKANEDDKKTE